MSTFDLRDAAANLPRLIELAEAGDEVVITRGGMPVARLEAVRERADHEPRRPGAWKGRIALDGSFFEPLPDGELALWEGGAAEDSPLH
ncbi:MAG: antitoxin [Chloroflexi bacterium]|nr:antitoxin [Chloroflexota bacterium]